ncbi:MAG: Mur ligase domain-containing protein, partial [Verrucomicrobiota bacterium]
MELLFGSLRLSKHSYAYASFGMGEGGGGTSAPPAPMLGTLFEGMPVLDFRGEKQTPVRSLVTDSRRVTPGALFFALGGLRTDGNLYIEEAIDRGAVAPPR